MKPANRYPFYCPKCGAQRMLQDAESKTVVFVGPMGEPEEAKLIRTRKSTDSCGRCGFEWKGIADPGASLSRKLTAMTDSDLVNIMKLFYPSFHNLVSQVAKAHGSSIGHVQRVLDGDRKSPEIDKQLVTAFRARLAESSVDKLI